MGKRKLKRNCGWETFEFVPVMHEQSLDWITIDVNRYKSRRERFCFRRGTAFKDESSTFVFKVSDFTRNKPNHVWLQSLNLNNRSMSVTSAANSAEISIKLFKSCQRK